LELDIEPKSEPLLLGIDLGGTKILAAVANPHGKVLAREYSATPAQKGPEAVVQAILETAHRTLAKAGITTAHLAAIGVGAAGTSNPHTGIISYSPNLPGWKDIPLRDIVEGELGVKTFVGNDANAAALGELYFGAGRGARNLVYVTLSTGIGGGIIIDGKLYTGKSGAAGEVGHMTIDVNGLRCRCGNIGCWETLASGTALAGEARRRISEGAKTTILARVRGDIKRITAQTVHEAAREGDALASELIAQTGYYAGVGFVNLINIFNPEVIIIGGGLSNMGNMLLEPAMKVVEERTFRAGREAVRLAIAQLGDDSGVLGLAALALQKMNEYT
jgi:glucokinase